jgi:HEAT repeat protein
MPWRRLLIILAVCAAVIAVVVALIPREPKYDGRTLSEWIKDSAPRRSPDPEQTRAIEAVRHIGTNGLPCLIKWIGAKEPADWQIKLTRANSRLPRWIRLRLLPSLFGFNSYKSYRRLALDGFLVLGPEAAPAVPDLLQIVASSPKGSPASGALESIGAAGLPPALSVLTNRANSAELRVAAALCITRIDPKVESGMVLSLMSQCIRNSKSGFRHIAAGILASRRAEPELVVPILTSWLTNSDFNARFAATFGLGQYGERATSAVPALVLALKDPLVGREAGDALFAIDAAALEKADPFAAERKKQQRRFIQEHSSPER